jgi:hypothetical protein
MLMVIGVLGTIHAQARAFTFEKISNELSLYQNYTDRATTRGQTVQVVAINRFQLGWWFQTEFAADFNYDYDKPNKWDYYYELGVMKSLVGGLSVNYQRVKGTFVTEPINQIGLRWRF